MKYFINTMTGYWFLLLAISLGISWAIYETWLKGVV